MVFCSDKYEVKTRKRGKPFFKFTLKFLYKNVRDMKRCRGAPGSCCAGWMEESYSNRTLRTTKKFYFRYAHYHIFAWLHLNTHRAFPKKKKKNMMPINFSQQKNVTCARTASFKHTVLRIGFDVEIQGVDKIT